MTGAASNPSQWQNNGSVWVGNAGNGTLCNVSSGGNGYIAFGNNTTGYALVGRANSTWSTAVNLYVGGKKLS